MIKLLPILVTLAWRTLRWRVAQTRVARFTREVGRVGVVHTSDATCVRWAMVLPNGSVLLPTYLDRPGWLHIPLGDRYFAALNEEVHRQTLAHEARKALLRWVDRG